MNASEAGKLGWKATAVLHKARRAKFRAAYDAAPKHCKWCDKPIPYARRENKYCNRHCAGFGRPRKLEKQESATESATCEGCGKAFIVKRSCLGKYCSNQCQQNNKSRKLFEAGLADRRCARHNLLKSHGNVCWICKITRWQGQPVALVLDHIDGNSDNNQPANLRMVCPNCDAQLPTYKGKNRGNGRAYRRERYHQGKSY
jgi:hypothetical protein